MLEKMIRSHTGDLRKYVREPWEGGLKQRRAGTAPVGMYKM